MNELKKEIILSDRTNNILIEIAFKKYDNLSEGEQEAAKILKNGINAAFKKQYEHGYYFYDDTKRFEDLKQIKSPELLVDIACYLLFVNIKGPSDPKKAPYDHQKKLLTVGTLFKTSNSVRGNLYLGQMYLAYQLNAGAIDDPLDPEKQQDKAFSYFKEAFNSEPSLDSVSAEEKRFFSSELNRLKGYFDTFATQRKEALQQKLSSNKGGCFASLIQSVFSRKIDNTLQDEKYINLCTNKAICTQWIDALSSPQTTAQTETEATPLLNHSHF